MKRRVRRDGDEELLLRNVYEEDIAVKMKGSWFPSVMYSHVYTDYIVNNKKKADSKFHSPLKRICIHHKIPATTGR